MNTIILFIIVLAVLVLIHELGHFITARLFGVKAEEFGFGFPPRIIGVQTSKRHDIKLFGFNLFKRKRHWRFIFGNRQLTDHEASGNTVYSLNWLPLGGFVKIKGENNDGGHDKDSLNSQPIWQRAIIMFAGVFANIVLAIVLISLCFMIGAPQDTQDIGPGVVVKNHHIQILEVLPNTPAQTAGITAGDIIAKVNGTEFKTYQDLQAFVAAHVNQDLNYQISRGDQTLDKKIKPIVMKETGKGGIGIVIAETGIVSYPFFTSITKGFTLSMSLLAAIVVGIYDLIKSAFAGADVGAQVAGPVGIAKITGQMAQLGLVYVIQFMAMLSLNLAVINFLPLPALDGGRLLFLLIEKIKRSPVKREVEALIHNIGFIILIILILLVTYHDIAKLFIKTI